MPRTIIVFDLDDTLYSERQFAISGFRACERWLEANHGHSGVVEEMTRLLDEGYMRALFEQDGVKPSELAATLGLTRGAISKLIDRVAAKGIVSVRNDVRDRRAQFVTLKASGRRLVPTLAALADENDAEAFGHLEPEQRAALLATLRRIAEHLGIRGAPVD